MFLANSDGSIKIALTATPTTELNFSSHFFDKDGLTNELWSHVGETDGTTLVDLVPAPALDKARAIQTMTIYNPNVAPVELEITLHIDTESSVLWKGLLGEDQLLEWTHRGGWHTVNGYA